MQKLQGKWAFITGSSRGIGQQIALGLAREGCNLILHAREADHCLPSKQLLAQYNSDVRIVSGELGQRQEEDQIIQAVLEQVQTIDILYNNAGVMSQWQDSAFNIPDSEWLRIYQVNFLAIVRLCNAFCPLMQKQRWGRVINLSTGMTNTPQLTPYSTAKAALDKYTREISYALKESNVLVNGLDPGWLKTDMGGEQADHEVTSVLPGALVPALLDDFGPSGQIFKAQDYRDQSGPQEI